jgi:hypothetical protein
MSDVVRLDRESIEALAAATAAAMAAEVARLVLEATRGKQPAPFLLTAAEVAERFGVSRRWVYDNRDELGAVRLGSGPKGRLRFDADTVAEAMHSRCTSRESDPPGSGAGARIRQQLQESVIHDQLQSLPKQWRDAVAAGTRARSDGDPRSRRDVGPRGGFGAPRTPATPSGDGTRAGQRRAPTRVIPLNDEEDS